MSCWKTFNEELKQIETVDTEDLYFIYIWQSIKIITESKYNSPIIWASRGQGLEREQEFITLVRKYCARKYWN